MKKITTFLLILAIAASMTACSGKTDASAVSESAPESVAVESVAAEGDDSATNASEAESDDATDPDEIVGVALADFPNMMEQDGATVYAANDGSLIAVMSAPADAATLEEFSAKGEEDIASFNEQFKVTMSSMYPELDMTADEPKSEFITLDGKNVLSMSIVQNGESFIMYVLASADSIHSIVGMSKGTDVVAAMAEIVNSL